MRKQLIQEVRGVSMPRYLCEILTNNYCEGFLKMNIVRDEERYIFSYDTGFYKRLSRDKLITPGKLYITKEMFRVNELGENHLIFADRYLIEPELVFIRKKFENGRNARLMYYPDSSGLGFNQKMIKFMRSLYDLNIRDESEAYNIMKELLEAGDYNNAYKYISRKVDSLGIQVAEAI